MRRNRVRRLTVRKTTLKPSGQDGRVQKIVTEFAENFTPGGVPRYIGSAAGKLAYFDREGLAALGVDIETPGKMPDVVIYDTERNWLVLVEPKAFTPGDFD